MVLHATLTTYTGGLHFSLMKICYTIRLATSKRVVCTSKYTIYMQILQYPIVKSYLTCLKLMVLNFEQNLNLYTYLFTYLIVFLRHTQE